MRQFLTVSVWPLLILAWVNWPTIQDWTLSIQFVLNG